LGWLFVLIGAIAALVQGFLFGRIERHTGARALLIVGLFGMGVSIAALPWAGTSLLVYAWTVPLAFTNSLFAPAASGLVSLYADPTEQGTILGAAQWACTRHWRSATWRLWATARAERPPWSTPSRSWPARASATDP